MYANGAFRIDHNKAARAFMIVLWASGGRPAEILNLTAKDIKRDELNNIILYLKTLKGGNARELYLSLSDKFVKELWEYCASITIPDMYLFHMFRSKRVKTHIRVTKKRKNPITGEIESYLYKEYDKAFDCVSDRILYYFQRWTKGVMDDANGRVLFPYYFRHSRLTQIAGEDGNTIEDVKRFKGAKSYRSCEPYMHATKRQLIKLGKGALK